MQKLIDSFSAKAYQRLYDWAQRDPLNAKAVPDGYEEFLKPLIKAKL